MRFAARFAVLAVLLLAAVFALGQPRYITWSAKLEPSDPGPGRGAEIVLSAKLEGEWHLYSPTTPQTPEEAPVRTRIELVEGGPLEVDGKLRMSPFVRKMDPNFGIEVEMYGGSAEFRLPVRVKEGMSGAQTAKLTVRYQLCDDTSCLRPTTDEVPLTFTVGTGGRDPLNEAPGIAAPEGAATAAPPGAESGKATAAGTDAFSRDVQEAKQSGLLRYLAFAFLAGLLSLLTPCVFPMIPITVSYFSKQQQGLKGPLAYALGIILTFTALGVAIAAIFGVAGLQTLATNPWLNLALGILFVALALNLFGVYEIRIPAGLASKLQTGGQQKGGVLGPILMAVAFTITSFTCTMPFVGTVLVGATQGDFVYPILGMLSYSTAFALPFFLLALFPGAMANRPKSGPWMSSVKVTMGFLEIAAAVKFFSNVDLVWQLGLLTRPVFLTIWVSIAAITAAYLLGWIRLGNEEAQPIGWTRRSLGVGFLALMVWMIPGVDGKALGEIDSFLPPSPYPGREGTTMAQGRIQWLSSWDEAVAKSKETGKPIFVDFTGVTCTNCRWMEKNMFPQPAIEEELSQFVTVKLYTDREKESDRANAKLQDEMTGVATLPVYVVTGPDGKPLQVFQGMTRVESEFEKFLESGRQKFGTGPVAQAGG